jgi:hypothetical protein
MVEAHPHTPQSAMYPATKLPTSRWPTGASAQAGEPERRRALGAQRLGVPRLASEVRLLADPA